jgi:urease accessory protein
VRDGRSVLLECQGTYPLQVLRPHVVAADGGLSLVVLLQSGGLLDGDEVSIDVVVEAGARLALRTQAATQVHAGRSQQALRATVHQDGWFSYVPHALVPHAAADHHARTVVYLKSGARALVAEALSPGRVHSGEEFAYARVRLDLDVWCNDSLIARERALLTPDPATRGAQFGPATHTGSVYVLGPGEPPVVDSCEVARVGVSELAQGGWCVRALAQRAADLEATLGQLHAQWWNS